MKLLCYLNPRKGNAREMMEAFAAGSGAEVTTRLEFVPEREAVFWGVDRETLPIWRRVIETATPYWYVDNGYFRSKWTGGSYYRVTRNAEQCSGTGESDGSRWRKLLLRISPWTCSGRHVLVACQSDFWHERHGHGSAAEFGAAMSAELARHTTRPVIVRGKPIGGHKEPPLAEHLRDCWSVVTYSSILAAEAILAGVPAIVLAKGAMQTVARNDISEIERPLRSDDRERWAAVLADNQWTPAEIRNGAAFAALNS